MARPSRHARGYDSRHVALRNAVGLSVEAGEAICWRCRRPIAPGSDWHLGHDDHDRTVYRGAEHAGCNLHAAGVKGSAARAARKAGPRTSRTWVTQRNKGGQGEAPTLRDAAPLTFRDAEPATHSDSAAVTLRRRGQGGGAATGSEGGEDPKPWAPHLPPSSPLGGLLSATPRPPLAGTLHRRRSEACRPDAPSGDGPSAVTRRVVLVCGPPGAGKTTLARSLGLRVLDRDDAAWRSEAAFAAALRDIGADHTARAVVIRSAPTLRNRQAVAERVGATEVVVLAVPLAECVRRLRERGRPNLRSQIAAARDWWARYEPGDVTAAPLPTTRRWT